MFRLKLLFQDWHFWVASLSIWGVIWSVTEGALFALQLTGALPNATLGYFILILFVLAILIGGWKNWPLRTLDATITKTGVKIRLRFGDFWKQSGEKIVGVTRCFNTTVDDVIIHSHTLHGSFIKRNFANNREAKVRIDSELGRSNGGTAVFEPGKTIKITGAKDTAFLVGITTLDSNNQASVKLDEYFVALGAMWEFVKERSGGDKIICPLLGSGRARLNYNSSSIFYELLNSALIAMRNGFITADLTFIIYPDDIEKGYVDLKDVKDTFHTLCASENLHRMTVEGSAEGIDV